MHAIVRGLLVLGIGTVPAFGSESWPRISLANPRQVELRGALGVSLERGVERISQPPYTTDWLLSDVAFKVDRIFTNYSGDVSGRFLELAALTSRPGRFSPPTFQPVAAEIAKYQKVDGHFGLEMDFTKPMQKMSPPIPMLWGNARLLVGLVTAANELHDTNLLAAARRLGDFYISTADIFCSAARATELRATGTGGDGYTCCYFPAIESLALLYRATHDESYLAQAQRMAEWFKKFDALPTDHSHGNLCAWRGILELYDITGEHSYLDRALAKWESAVQDGYVWPLGGVGEHWYRFHSGDEGCSESDWLRFNLELWRFTGDTRFLDMAERLLRNQYAGNQCANGGYGWRPFDGDADGPIGTSANLDEWYFCCSFHGPLGLHFLKAYLAAGSSEGVYINFPFDFTSTIKSGAREFRVTVKQLEGGEELRQAELKVKTLARKSASTMLFVRKPAGATEIRLATSSGKALPFSEDRGYLMVKRKLGPSESLRLSYRPGFSLEHRRFTAAGLDRERISRVKDVAMLHGADVLFATPAAGTARLTLLAQIGKDGQLQMLRSPNKELVTVALPGLATEAEQVAAALEKATIVRLQPESELHSRRRAAFMHDVVVVPAGLIPAETLARFSERVRNPGQSVPAAGFGEHLEKNPDAWLCGTGWQFGAEGLRVTGGDVGLLDFNPGADYRFEFDLQLPEEGQGIAGWVVRAQGQGDCLLFQIQSSDSTYDAPQFKTRPNTLRPHVRRYGEWQIADPIPLPKQIRRGETHHMAVDCRGSEITVFLDGEKIYTGQDGGFNTGSVGFRAASPAEAGIYRNISLRKSG